jgi:predicted N-acetyltransferase YhbS
MVEITIREALPGDRATIAAIIVRCYQDVAFSNHREHLMVARLQASSAYIAQLSLVAEIGGVMAGHVMMTRIAIKDPAGEHTALSLAPLSVSPVFQRQGVGSALVEAAHARARALGFGAVILVGIIGYYARFGYVPLDEYPISLPFDVAPANCMAIALSPHGLAGVRGMVEYAPEWMET